MLSTFGSEFGLVAQCRGGALDSECRCEGAATFDAGLVLNEGSWRTENNLLITGPDADTRPASEGRQYCVEGDRMTVICPGERSQRLIPVVLKRVRE
jgi:hypothetical protein